jgi:prevent-host-death family protein
VKTIKASEFKARCLALMDEVAASGEPIVITKNGEPISQLVPYRRPLKSLFGLHRDTLRVEGDIVKPVAVDWEAER